jgi:hypothetical protein
MILVVVSTFMTYGGYERISFLAGPSIFPKEETAKMLTDEFWNEIGRLGVLRAIDGQRTKELTMEHIV